MILYYTKTDRAIFTKVGFSLISLLSFTLFLTTKRHPSDVEPNYIPTFRLIQSAVYPVGVSKDCSCFAQMIDYNFKELVRILTKIDTNICLWIPYKCTKFQPNQSTHFRVIADFSICAKRRRRRRKKRRTKLKLWSLVSRKRLVRFTSILECSLPL